MGLLTPGSGQKPHHAKNATSEGDDELTGAAELAIVLFPADSSASDNGAGDAGDTVLLPKPLAGLMRRIGLQAWGRMPDANTGELLGTIRLVTWAVLVLGTLAIMVPAGTPAWAIITVTLIGLTGFATGTLALRQRRKSK